MKNAFMTVLRYVVKAIYPLVKAKRYIFKRVKSFFSKSSKRGNSNFPNSVITKTEKTRRYDPHPRTGRRNTYAKPYMSSSSESRTRYRHKKLPIWKDKRVIAGAGALVVIITGVLAVSLPAGGNNVYAGIGAVSSANPSPKTSLETAVPEGSEDPKYVSYNHNNLGSLAGNVSGGITSIIKENPLPEASSLPTTDPLQTPIPTTAPDVMELSPGCHDSRITDIQMRLMELGYMEADEPTDYYGWGTEYSLQLFQRRHNLQIDGIAGKETLTKLFDPDAKPYSVKIKDRGTDVKAIQERLKELRYLKSTANGVFGEDTENAVKAFQKRNGLASDGSVGEMTRETLFSEDAKEAPQPKPLSKPTSKPTTKPKATAKPTSGSGGSNPPVGDPDKASVEELIKVAKSVLGSKYVRGGKGPTTFDCSGLVYYALNKAGRSIGYRTSTQWKSSGLSKVTKMSDMKAGDIIVFKTRHVGIYIGNGLMIDASSSHGKVVQRSCMTDHWKKEFYCAVRVL